MLNFPQRRHHEARNMWLSFVDIKLNKNKAAVLSFASLSPSMFENVELCNYRACVGCAPARMNLMF